MFESVQHSSVKWPKNTVIGLGTNLAKRQAMKHSISTKELTLLAGILVAVIVVIMLASASFDFSAYTPTISLPNTSLPTLTEIASVAVQKIKALF